MNIFTDVASLKGIGEKTRDELNKCGIFNIMDLLLYFPRDYENIAMREKMLESDVGGKIIIECEARAIERDLRTKTNKIISTVVFFDGNSFIKAKWFNQPYVKNKFKIGFKYVLKGKVEKIKNETLLSNPIILNLDRSTGKNEDPNETKMVPVYPLKGKLTNNFFVKLINQVLNTLIIEENMPEYLLSKYNLISLDKAIRQIHYPKNNSELAYARQRLKFQELFIYSMKILMLSKFLNTNKEGISFCISPELAVLKEKLPFSLTNSQSKVIREILLDQKRTVPMNRLVQGDVGSGKTIVAIIAMFNVVMNGYQAALMAPTEILANQHYSEIKKVLKDYDLNIKLLCGSTSDKEKASIRKELNEGTIQIVVGTHALIEDNICFSNLGMVVTDEQHRFGVGQRSKLFNKGKNIDMLVMTATPIPRTLSLYMYGDLDVSVIDELPPGRKEITTYYTEKSHSEEVYNFALEEIKSGRQVYIVCPLVEENEELDLNSVDALYNELKESHFKNIETKILHGKMQPKLKDSIMNSFKDGSTKVLVSTTVIEVGINVPNATVMIIENAERFGLAQLHQLRGRVGRGSHKSYCILLANIKSDTVKKRMEIMKKSNDGFYIAEEDLKIRGSGQLVGYRQHGDEGFILADPLEDFEILKQANSEAKTLLSSSNYEYERIKKEIAKNIENSSKFICFN